MTNIKDLIKKAKEVTSSGLPFMQGREKDDLTMGAIYHINEYGFLEGDDGHEFAVFTASENENTFYYGGSVVSQKLKDLENELSSDDLATLLQYGIEVIFIQKMSKNKKKYTTCEFFPSAE